MCLCTNFGLVTDDRLCGHCIENRKYYRAAPRRINGRMRSLTPFQAKTAEAVTVKAWDRPEPLANYLKDNPSLYGVDVRTGELIGVALE